MCFSKITLTNSVYFLNYENYFEDLLESIPDHGKIILIIFLFKSDIDFLKECGFVKKDINR